MIRKNQQEYYSNTKYCTGKIILYFIPILSWAKVEEWSKIYCRNQDQRFGHVI